MPGPRRQRCAIYTRKSTEDGLEQDFNSLDAQREACAAYILSQQHEGWSLVPGPYDDGGFSGGNMERPALRELLADVEAGRVDVIVVYKVDRLTRSLVDFAKIVEVLDAKGASFVSVTQAFNTTTSMGRLTLNVLLSFAQFEREVTGERIRDKIAASKKKGLWMGGSVPLGYSPHERTLVIVPGEADVVRHVFRRYAALRSVAALVDELDRDGYRTRVRVLKDGCTAGGIPFGKGMVAALLQNRIYRGEIVHKGSVYPGQHDAIIDADLWDAVQQVLAENRVRRRLGTNARIPSLLTGLISDHDGRPMSPDHAVKDGKRYRYYATRRRPNDGLRASDVLRIPAGEIEGLVIARLADWHRQMDNLREDRAAVLDECIDARMALATRLGTMPRQDIRALLLRLQVKVRVAATEVVITLMDEECSPAEQELRVAATLAGHRHDVRLVLGPGELSAVRIPDPVLIRLIAQAFTTREAVLSGKPDPVVSSFSLDHQRRLARLGWLAPDIVRAILEGTQPASLNARRLLRASNLPLDWPSQRRMFGFA